ncbi:HTH_17 domain-containing protein [Burkholderia multivorans]
MYRNNAVVEHDHHHPVADECAASTISAPLVQPPAFLSLPLWTTEETADYLRCEPQTIRKAISQKGQYHGLKPRRFGRRWLFSAAEARAMVEAA